MWPVKFPEEENQSKVTEKTHKKTKVEEHLTEILNSWSLKLHIEKAHHVAKNINPEWSKRHSSKINGVKNNSLRFRPKHHV